MKNGKVFTSKSVGTGPSSYEKRIYRAAVSQRLRNAALGDASLVFRLFQTETHFRRNSRVSLLAFNRKQPSIFEVIWGGMLEYWVFVKWRRRRFVWVNSNQTFDQFRSSYRQWRTQEFCSGGGGLNKFSWGQRERESEGGSPLVMGFWRQL